MVDICVGCVVDSATVSIAYEPDRDGQFVDLQFRNPKSDRLYSVRTGERTEFVGLCAEDFMMIAATLTQVTGEWYIGDLCTYPMLVVTYKGTHYCAAHLIIERHREAVNGS